jgi:hypothetical protein
VINGIDVIENIYGSKEYRSYPAQVYTVRAACQAARKA